MLYSERKRMREISEREAAGESLWTENIPHGARVKIAHTWEVLGQSKGHATEDEMREAIGVIFRRNGIRGHIKFPAAFEDLTDTDVILTHVEAVWTSLTFHGLHGDRFEATVNEAFNEHRVSFRMVGGQVIPFKSDELHVHVIEPVLRLLIDSRFDGAHQCYLKALKEISNGEPEDAITDAGTALQTALATLGFQGNSLGNQVRDAKKRGLLAPHDETLASGIAKFMYWAAADRSETGDGHKFTEPELSDAWLMVHVVGALILRLADAAPRGIVEQRG